MNNSSLTSADRLTHLKIVVVSLLSAIIVVGVGVMARSDLTFDSAATGASTRLEASGPIIRAGKPVVMTTRETPAIR